MLADTVTQKKETFGRFAFPVVVVQPHMILVHPVNHREWVFQSAFPRVVLLIRVAHSNEENQNANAYKCNTNIAEDVKKGYTHRSEKMTKTSNHKNRGILD